MPTQSRYGRLADEIDGLKGLGQLGTLCLKLTSNVGLILEALRAADARHDDGK